jgi:hypothetical protein
MAVEQRLRSKARTAGRDMGRLRQLLVFDRFLARIFRNLGQRVVAKGGLVLELRLERARTTKDVDLWMTGDPDRTLDILREAGRLDLGDYLAFVVEPDKDHPVIEGEGMVYDGKRFRCEARLAGKIYGNPFGVDVGFGDNLTETPDEVDGSDFLDFVDAPRGRLRIYPRPTHVAEKLHAYTLPRVRENTRVKDLPDLALLAKVGTISATELRKAVEATFTFRKTHVLPKELLRPPLAWEPVYARMAGEDELPWATLDAVFDAVCLFLDRVLRGQPGQWDAESWLWRDDG